MPQDIKSFAHFAAKSGGSGWLPVWMHAADTAAVMEHLCTTWLPLKTILFLQAHGVPDVLPLAKFLAYVHDTGKITNSFQVKISYVIDGLGSDLADKGVPLCVDFQSGCVSHAAAGEALLLKMNIPAELASIIGSHHGRPAVNATDANLMTCYYRDFFGNPDNQLTARAWQMAAGGLVKWALEQSGLSIKTLPKPDAEAQIVLTGLVIAADWIASNSYLFPPISRSTYGLAIDYETRRQRALDRLHLSHRLESVGLDFDEHLFEHTFGFPMNEVQRMVMEMANQTEAPGLVILEAPMGVGKTEAALALADMLIDGDASCGGLYFGLPTQATANGIFPRLKNWAEKKCLFDSQTIALAHENAMLNPDYQTIRKSGSDMSDSDGMLMRHDLFNRSKLTLLADFVIGTIDQLLISGLKQKHFMLRHLGLVSKIVVIDEVHAYDARMCVFLKSVLAWLGAYHVPVVLLSATLPSDRRCELVGAYLQVVHPEDIQSNTEDWMTTCAYPLLTYTSGRQVCQKTCSVKDLRKLSVQTAMLPEDRLADEIRPVICNQGCAAVIVNSVKFSQKLAADLKRVFPDAEIILLHSSFMARHRVQIENKILSSLGKKSDKSSRRGVILIGTQVLEQSLDYDVDLMVSEICPMDLLLQRMGRLWRHAGHDSIRSVKRPKFFVLEPAEKQYGTEKIYPKYLLRRTAEELPDIISLPDDISPLVQRVYDYTGHASDSDCMAWQSEIKKETNSAKCVALGHAPGMRDWHGLLDIVCLNGSDADMSVRNTGVSLAPVCLFKQADGLYRTFDGMLFDITVCPDADAVKVLLNHRMPLPYRLVHPFSKAQHVADELAAMSQPFAEWQSHVSLLEHVLFCVFDSDSCVNLGGSCFEYHKEFGFLERGDVCHAV